MSLNQSAPLQGANTGFGGQAAGQYEPLAVPVTSKTSNRAVASGAIARGAVITVEKGGASNGKIRIATAGDVGPFGMAYKTKANGETRIEFISIQQGFIGYVIADGVIKPGAAVKPTTGGKVIAAVVGTTVDDAKEEVVGTYISKAAEVSKSGSGVYVPSDAAQNDIIRVAYASSVGEIF